jgi:CBS domain-containing protein
MIVREIMTTRVETIGPDATVEDAARRMREVGVGALAVCERDRPVGIVTDRDLVVRSAAEGADPTRALVRSAMTPQLVACSDADDVEAAAATMRRHAVRRVLVLDAAGRLAGLLSVDDLALRSPALAGGVIEHARAPERPDVPRTWRWRE